MSIKKVTKKPRKIRKKADSSLSSRHKYLSKKFQITEEEYNKQLARQNGKCWICKKPPTAKSLAVDHDHYVEKLKIISSRTAKGWMAWVPGVVNVAEDRLKSKALSIIRTKLKRLSVRGLLCWKCNTALKKFNDDAHLMKQSSFYIENYRSLLYKGLNGFGDKI